jgi:hypothetical protein
MQGDGSTSSGEGSAAVTPEIREWASVEQVAEMRRLAFRAFAALSTCRRPPADDSLASAGGHLLAGIFLDAELMLSRHRVHRMIAGHLADVARGTLRVLVDRRDPLAEATTVHAYGESGEALDRVLLVP